MSISRRKFLGWIGAAGLATTVGKRVEAAGGKHFTGYPRSGAVLHDTTLCIGCRVCEAACNAVNELPAPEKSFKDQTVLGEKRRTNSKTYTVVNKYTVVGESQAPPVFRKNQCNHCLEPACASACFVEAFKKTPSGAVTYDASVCVGCRYCMIACSFAIPAYEYDNPTTPVVRKCTLCYPRISKGKLPGCVEKCPTEALVFGERQDLLKIARERIRKHPERYINHIYGENEMGGTSWLYLSGVAFEKLGLRENLGVTPAPQFTKGALGAVPMVVGLWPVFLTGVWAMNKRKDKIAAQELDATVTAAVEQANREAAEKLAASMEKVAKEKKTAIEKEVKKAVAAAEEAWKEKAMSADEEPEPDTGAQDEKEES